MKTLIPILLALLVLQGQADITRYLYCSADTAQWNDAQTNKQLLVLEDGDNLATECIKACSKTTVNKKFAIIRQTTGTNGLQIEDCYCTDVEAASNQQSTEFCNTACPNETNIICGDGQTRFSVYGTPEYCQVVGNSCQSQTHLNECYGYFAELKSDNLDRTCEQATNTNSLSYTYNVEYQGSALNNLFEKGCATVQTFQPNGIAMTPHVKIGNIFDGVGPDEPAYKQSEVINGQQSNRYHTVFDYATKKQEFTIDYEDFESIGCQNYTIEDQDTAGLSDDQLCKQCEYPVRLYFNGLMQFEFINLTTVCVFQQTKASSTITVNPTLVAGQCCVNSLSVESELVICTGTDLVCPIANHAPADFSVTRNSEFILKHFITTEALKGLRMLPETIKIGPFFADIIAHDNSVAGVIIYKTKSNVAFFAEITVTSDVEPWTRRTLSEGQRLLQGGAQSGGSADTQFSEQKSLHIIDPPTNKQDTKSSAKKDDNEPNVAILAVIIVAAIIIIAGIVVVFGCLYKKQKQTYKGIKEQPEPVSEQRLQA